MSPELYYQFSKGEATYEYNIFKNDVYGLGVMLIEIALLERRSDRKSEAQVDPYKNDVGPCD